MANIKKMENLCIRVSAETRVVFDELFQETGSNSKGEFLAYLLEHFSEEPKQPEPQKETVEVQVERPLAENEILVKLNKVQQEVLKNLVGSSNERKDSNKTIDRIDQGLDQSYWGDDLFSGDFKGVLNKYTCEDTPEKMKEDMGQFLANFLMLMLIRGVKNTGYNSDSIKSLVKKFAKEQKAINQEPVELPVNASDKSDE